MERQSSVFQGANASLKLVTIAFGIEGNISGARYPPFTSPTLTTRKSSSGRDELYRDQMSVRWVENLANLRVSVFESNELSDRIY